MPDLSTATPECLRYQHYSWQCEKLIFLSLTIKGAQTEAKFQYEAQRDEMIALFERAISMSHK